MKENPLYKELGHIGRLQKSLEPAGLLSYEKLLHCREVNRRVAANATDLQRAEALQNAITEIVASIGPEDDRRIAEAALCTVGKYVNASVKDRKKSLDEEYKINPEKYGDRRPWVLAHIVKVLEGPGTRKQPPLRPPGADNYLGYNLMCLWRDAFTLHCAGLASLYVFQNSDLPFGEHPSFEACAKSHFDALTIFLYGTHYSCVAYPSVMEGWLKHCLDGDTVAWLLRTVSLLNSHCPLLQQTDEDVDALLFVFTPVATRNGIHIRDLYTFVWKSWYFSDLRSADVLASIERMTGQSGAIGTVLREARCVGANQPLEEEIYGEIFDAVDRYYGNRTHEPIVNGKSLWASFDAFCTDRGPTLAKNEMP